MKIYRRIRTWVMAGLLFAILALYGFMTHHYMPPVNDNWQPGVEQEITQMERTLTEIEDAQYRKQLEARIEVNRYYLEQDINPNAYTGWKFASESSNLIILVTIFTAIVAGDIVASEFSWGTVKLLLIRPVNRTKILLAKYLASLLFAFFLLILLFLWSYLMGGVLFGFGSLDMQYIYADQNAVVHEMSMVVHVLQTYGLQLVELLMIVTISFMISTALRSSSMAIGLSLVLQFLGATIAVELATTFEWAKYLLFANTNLSQYLVNNPLHPSMTLGFSITILVVHFVAFHLISWWMFVKRDVAS